MANGHGGKRPNSGRKPKVDEQILIERLTPMADDAYKALHQGVKTGEPWAIKMWMEYYHGKPKETVAMEVQQPKMPKFSWNKKDDGE